MRFVSAAWKNRRRLAPIALVIAMLVSVAAACGDSAEMDYAQSVKTETDNLVSGFNDLTELMDQAASDASLFDNVDWKGKLNDAAAKVKAADAALNALTPPDRFKEVHAALIDATGDCSAAMDALSSGIESKDFDLMNKSIELMTSCSNKLTAANDQLDTLK
jgi:hypothetical protein